MGGGGKAEKCMFSERPDLSAGDLYSGVSGRLGGEVVRGAVQDNGSAQDILYGEPIGQERQKSPFSHAEYRR